MASPCTQRASSNIDAFPSAIVLPKQKPEDHSLENSSLTSPSLPLIRNQWATHWLMERTLELRLKRGIWIASLAWILWTAEPLETFCRHVVRAGPFSFQCSRSALPPVICTLSSLRSTCWQQNVRGVTTAVLGERCSDVAYILCLAVITLLCWLSVLYSCAIKTNLWGQLRLQEQNTIK